MNPRITLCLEQTLGHRTHSANLEASALRSDHDIHCLPVPYSAGRLPWALRGSWQACRRLRAVPAADVTLFHTQTIGLLAGRATRHGRYVISVDATPRQLDAFGRWYQHGLRPGVVESAKLRWYRSVIANAASVVCWSQWAADSVIAEYGGSPSRILIAHPGATTRFFAIPRPPAARSGKPTILFVGGDFERKGGADLLRAFEPLAPRANLLLVTDAEVTARPGVRVESGVAPNSDRLLRLYAEADLFCLPTHGDCTPVVLGEAMAAGLAPVTTRIGSNHETVVDGHDGVLVDPGDVPALSEALCRLVDDPSLRTRMGAAARDHARDAFDADANARRVLAHLVAVAS